MLPVCGGVGRPVGKTIILVLIDVWCDGALAAGTGKACGASIGFDAAAPVFTGSGGEGSVDSPSPA